MTTSLSAHLSQRHGRGLAHLWTLYSTFKNVNKCCELIIFAWNVEPKCGQTNRNWLSKDFKWAIFCCWQCKSKCGQTWTVTSSMPSAVYEIYISCNFAMLYECWNNYQIFSSERKDGTHRNWTGPKQPKERELGH